MSTPAPLTPAELDEIEQCVDVATRDEWEDIVLALLAMARRTADAEAERDEWQHACGEASKYGEKLQNETTHLREQVATLRKALEEIAKGRGEFDRDNYRFACNVIKAANETAIRALAATSTEESRDER